MAGIFISYRRTDSAAIAGRAYDRLVARYGSGSVFLDINDIPPGVDFRSHIASTIATCRVVLVFIGPDWISRIHRADDPVRVEIESGLATRATLIPVLIDGTRMPDQGTLPPGLQAFSFLNAARLDNSRDFDSQLEHLFRAIDGVQPVVKAEMPMALPSDARFSERPVLALPDKPSLAVLPFQNMSGDPEQEYFADGVVEDIITALSRTGWLFVIARNSSFSYKGKSPDIRTVGRELGVRYVLEGSVRRAGGRVRITCQLIEAATGGHIWADRFEGDLADIFEVQDRITESVVGAIEPSLKRAELTRASAKPTESMDAYDLFCHALHFNSSRDKAGLDAAVAFLRRSLAIDSAFPRAKAFLGATYAERISQGCAEANEGQMAVQLAREALATGSDDPEILHWTSIPISEVTGDFPEAMTLLHRSLRLNPNAAQALAALGHVYCFANDPDPAIPHFERAMRLSPFDPLFGTMVMGVGRAHLLAGRNEQALEFLQRSVREPGYNSQQPWRFMTVALMRLGRKDEMKAVGLHLLQVNPNARVGATVAKYPPNFYGPTFVPELSGALRLAGLPE